MAYGRNHKITIYRKDGYWLQVPIALALRLELEDGQVVTECEYEKIINAMNERRMW